MGGLGCVAEPWVCGLGFGGIGVHPLLAAFISSFRGLHRAIVTTGFIYYIVSISVERLVWADAPKGRWELKHMQTY